MSFESAGNNRGRYGSLITAVGVIKTTKWCGCSFFVVLTFPVKGVHRSCVLTSCTLTVRVSMVLLLGVVIIVLSEGVKDTTALDGGVVIDVLHVMQCVRSLSRLPTRARTLQLLQWYGGCVLSYSLPIYECVVEAWPHSEQLCVNKIRQQQRNVQYSRHQRVFTQLSATRGINSKRQTDISLSCC